MSDLRGQRVVIVGGSSGVGFSLAQRALTLGAQIFIGSSRERKIASALEQLGAEAKGATVNVGEERSTEHFFANVGSFDHLVFTAGDGGSVLTPHTLAQLDLAEAADGFKVRFWGALRAAKYAEPFLSATGSITLTSGIMSRRPRRGLAIAGAISGAIEHLIQGLAVDLAPRRVNAVCLGFTLTQDHADTMPEDRIRSATAQQLLTRPGTPDEVVEAYLYSMLGTYTTGQTLVADGGRTLA